MTDVEKQRLLTALEHWAQIFYHIQIFWAQIPPVLAPSWGITLDEVDTRPTKWKKNVDLFVMGSDWAVLEDFAVHLSNVMISVSEINLITICKCYNCFPNKPVLTLEACIYIHTHEPKTKWNADTQDQQMLKT